MELNSFGEIADEKIELSQMGKIAEKCWLEIPNHFPEVRLDEFVIMPNHVHGIIVIFQKAGDPNMLSRFSDQVSDRSKMYLSKVVQAFKSSVTRKINQNQSSEYFAWQKSFYDHIINHQKELDQTRRYILDNPIQWPIDNENFEKLFK